MIEELYETEPLNKSERILTLIGFYYGVRDAGDEVSQLV